MQEDWNAKVGKDACENWKGIGNGNWKDPSAMTIQMRQGCLLEFAIFNELVLAYTFGHQKTSRRWTWHSPKGQHHMQIDYILVTKRI